MDINLVYSIQDSLLTKLGISEDYDYQSNLLKIEIYYEEFNYQKIAERPSYSVGEHHIDPFPSPILQLLSPHPFPPSLTLPID